MKPLRSARAVTVALTGIQVLSKFLGSIRVLIVAWLFGVSAAMDGVNMALWIAAFFSSFFLEPVRSVMIPMLSRLRAENGEEEPQALMSLVWWGSICYLVIVAFFLWFTPHRLISLFAPGFEKFQQDVALVGLKLAIPFFFASSLVSTYEIYAIFKQRYLIASLVRACYNIFFLPFLLLLYRGLGVQSIIVASSATWGLIVLVMCFSVQDFPYRSWRQGVKYVPEATKESFYFCIVVGATTLYYLVDRYFASMLQEGGVTIISYASALLGVVVSFVQPVLFFFLARSSELAAQSGELLEKGVQKALSIAVHYGIPLGALCMALSFPGVLLILKRGAFDATSATTTAYCTIAYFFGLPFVFVNVTIWRYLQVKRLMRKVLWISYGSVVLNAALNWTFIRYIGAVGIALATSLVQVFCSVAYFCTVVSSYKHLLRGWGVSKQVFFSMGWSVICILIAHKSLLLGTVCSVISVGIYFILLVKTGWERNIPDRWRPRDLMKLTTGKFFNKDFS